MGPFPGWVKKGIVRLGQLYAGDTLKTFQALSWESGLPDSDLFQYMQPSHMLKAQNRQGCFYFGRLALLITVVFEENLRKGLIGSVY